MINTSFAERDEIGAAEHDKFHKKLTIETIGTGDREQLLIYCKTFMWTAECAGRHGLLKGGEIPRGETPLLDALQVDGSSSEVSVLSDGRRTGLAATCGSESLYPLLYCTMAYVRVAHVFFIFINATDGSNYILHIQVSPVLETVWGCWGLNEITCV
jgi:hypothetical protein